MHLLFFGLDCCFGGLFVCFPFIENSTLQLIQLLCCLLEVPYLIPSPLLVLLQFIPHLRSSESPKSLFNYAPHPHFHLIDMHSYTHIRQKLSIHPLLPFPSEVPCFMWAVSRRQSRSSLVHFQVIICSNLNKYRTAFPFHTVVSINNIDYSLLS